jgi:hypothetical protein
MSSTLQGVAVEIRIENEHLQAILDAEVSSKLLIE